jgi:Ca-activated chloride channel family protein
MIRLVLRVFVVSTILCLIALAPFLAGCSATAPAAAYEAAKIGTAGQPLSPSATAEAQPVPAEELWVIEKPEAGRFAKNDRLPQQAPLAQAQTQQGIAEQRRIQQPEVNELPGQGQLVARVAQQLVPVPLKHTDVRASITGYIATVDVTQQYHNPYAEKIEAIYVFPLPANAAVNEFIMTIGDRKIRGVIREREEARQIYENAKRQGYVASLLTQERPNVFTQHVANIEPGKRIDVNVKYFHTLEYTDGSYEFSFPMVVGPRFNPPGTTDGVGAAGRGNRGVSQQKTEVQYLKENERSGHDIALAVDIDAGVNVEEIKSINHRVTMSRPQEGRAHVALASDDKIPNKDFVLRYKVAGKTVKSALMAQKDAKGDGGYFTLMLFPPESLENLPRKPLEMVFTLDVSGSMSGQPIEQSKAAVRYALKNMRGDDTFNVIRFFEHAEQFAPRAVPANEQTIPAAMQYIEQMQAGGGTMMIEGIRQSLQVTPDPDRLRFVAFLTDGYIGNDAEILREVHNLRGPSRIFSFGVGQAPNRFLLDHMARMGQGCAAYLSLNDNADDVMAKYFARISHPALTDLSIDWGGMQVSDIYPAKLPDLFVGRPVVITGRYRGNPDSATVRVRGKVGGETREMPLAVNVADAKNAHAGITSVWARMKIADLADRTTYENNPELAGVIKQTALDYGLLSAFTAFVAVDSTQRTAGDHGTTVMTPVPVPEGVRYDTTVPQ